LHFRVETRHVHAERHLAKAGVASVKGRGLSHPWSGAEGGTEGAKRERRSAQAKRGRLRETLSRLIVEATILLAASRQNGTTVLKDAATLYKVNTEAIDQKVKQEFAAKAKAKKESKPEAKPVAKAKKAA